MDWRIRDGFEEVVLTNEQRELLKILAGRKACTLCDGTGHLPPPNAIKIAPMSERRGLTKDLRDLGYTIRQIVRIVGWKSTDEVYRVLKWKPRLDDEKADAS
jgi:hypothetical protein